MVVEDLMTRKIITVKRETALIEAVDVLTRNSFNGLPVVDDQGFLVGLLTEHDMIADSSYVHLKTLLNLFSQIKFYKKDHQPIREDLKKILSLKVSDVMNPHPQTVLFSVSVEEATRLFADPKNNPLPVVDQKNNLVGIISLSDLTKLYGVSPRRTFAPREVDQQIDSFIKNFEKQFVLVSNFRAKTWLMYSFLFALVGFIIAVFLIIRIKT